MSRFRYRALNPTLPEIRLLVIQPSFRKLSELKCKLIHADLDSLESSVNFYEALSYTWGDLADHESIMLENRPFPVTVNLAAALRRLRGRKRRCVLWVDAICINQEDLDERTSQVLKMHTIYQKAAQVLAWLGDEADNSGQAMDLIEMITDADTPDDWITDSLDNPADLSRWQALAHLFARPWWYRVWVRQEVAVASDLMVMCGNRKNTWKTLITACELLYRAENLSSFDLIHRSNDTQLESGLHQAIFIDTIRETFESVKEVKLDHLLLHFRACESSDPRDRVYAALGIVAEREVGHINPDYSISTSDVFERATRTIIEQSGSLQVLSACAFISGESGLPSWTPDFQTDWPALPLALREGGESLYNASRAHKAEYRFAQNMPQPHELILKGVIFDTIQDRAQIYGNDSTLKSDLDHWRQLATSTLRARSPALTNEEILNIYWRTLVADQDISGDRATQQTYSSFRNHITDNEAPIPCLDFEYGVTSFNQNFREKCNGRRLIATKSSRTIGLAPSSAEAGDLVAVLYGAGVPFVLRAIYQDQFVIIGECYVHGVMDGEVIENLQKGECMEREIKLR